jgi:hypothetical protein
MSPTPTGIAADPRVRLFDVGGVLVHLSGVECMLSWMGEKATRDKMWHMWLHSTPVRDFERGRIGAEEFAATEASQHVVDTLSCKPKDVLFLDDNTLNVEAAKRCGMQAVRVQGIGKTRQALVKRGIN